MSATGRPTRFLAITGLLFPDNRLVLSPGYTTEVDFDAVGPGETSLDAVVEGDEERVLLRHSIAVVPFVTDGEPVGADAVIGRIPLPEGTRRIRFERNGVTIHILEVPEAAPRLRLAWTPPEEPRGRVRVQWEGTHPEGRELEYAPFFSSDGGRTWQPLALPTTATAIEVDFDRLPGRRGRIAVLATDGVNTARAESRTFRLPQRPCLAMILAPEEDEAVAAGEELHLRGQGFYLETGEPEFEALEWSSSRDGPLGEGPALDVLLSPGRHEIELAAGRGRRRGTASVHVVVRRASSSR